MAAPIEQRCETIRKYERKQAKSIANYILNRGRSLSIWEVLIPIVFALRASQTSQQRDIFVRNYLFTKSLALDAAQAMRAQGQEREQALAQVARTTGELLQSVEQGLYSQGIRAAQLEEVELLLDHYLRLIDAAAGDYPAMLRAAYPTPEDYRRFLEELERREERVFQATTETMAENADQEYTDRVRSTTRLVRDNELKNLYSG
jgi:hypothetical protein